MTRICTDELKNVYGQKLVLIGHDRILTLAGNSPIHAASQRQELTVFEKIPPH